MAPAELGAQIQLIHNICIKIFKILDVLMKRERDTYIILTKVNQ